MYCLKCGKEIEDSAMACPYCGSATENAPVSVVNNVIPDSDNEAVKSAENMANIGMIVGVVGAILAWIFALLGYVCGGVALGLAFVAKGKNSACPKIKNAMIAGGVALACSVISSIIGVALMA